MKLYYFTFCYPYGNGEQWKANELKVLVKHFEEITVIPFFYGGNFDKPKALPKGVRLAGPLFKEIGLPGKKSDFFRILFHKNGPIFIKEFWRKKVYKKKSHFRSWAGSTLNIIRLLEHPVIKDVLTKADKNTVLYFYWGKGSSDMLPFIDTSRFRNIFVRMHRFDLFEYVNDNYIPFRKSLFNHISVAAPVSYVGKDHLAKLYPEASDRIKVFRIGTVGNGRRSSPSTDGLLRVVSCSGLSTVKRVDIMIQSLQYIQFPVIWRHIGDGVLEQQLRLLAQKSGATDRFIFEGKLDSEHIIDFYTDQPFDIFVNTSDNEGVPVSIMEAFAAGMPAMATDVGGTSEIVDDQVGKLLPSGVTPVQLAEELKRFYYLPHEKKAALRDAAFQRYLEKWNAEILSEELSEFLMS